MEWFRLWHDYFSDAKLKRLTKAQKYDVAFLLGLASANDPRGQIDLDDEDIAAAAEINDDEFALLVGYLERKEVTARNERGRIYFLNWDKRQPKSDNVAERVARSRARKTGKEPEQYCNVTVTDRTEHNRTEQNRTEESRADGRAAPIPPSREQVYSIASLIGMSTSQADRYFNNRSRTGWRVKGDPIVNWDSDLKYWHSNEHQFSTPLTDAAKTPEEKRQAKTAEWTKDYEARTGKKVS